MPDRIVDTDANHRYPCTACGGMGPHKGNGGHLYTTQPQKKPSMYVSSGPNMQACRNCGQGVDSHKTGLMFCPTSRG